MGVHGSCQCIVAPVGHVCEAARAEILGLLRVKTNSSKTAGCTILQCRHAKLAAHSICTGRLSYLAPLHLCVVRIQLMGAFSMPISGSRNVKQMSDQLCAGCSVPSQWAMPHLHWPDHLQLKDVQDDLVLSRLAEHPQRFLDAAC